MGKTVRIGFVGTGGIAGAHIRRLVEIPEAKITALCDIDESRVREKAEPLGAAVYTDAQKLIGEADIDALYVCVPPHAHGEIEVRAADRGLHLFVEKPVNLYLDQALHAWEHIKQAGVMTQAGYSMRYVAGSVQLKEFLAEHEVGSAHVFRWNGLPRTPWWRKYDQAGGQLVEMTTHQVDLLRWVMGEVVSVSAQYSFKRLFRDDPSITVPDSQAALLRFSSGASATINTACAAGHGYLGGVEFLVKDARVSWKPDGISIQPEERYERPRPPAETPSIDAAFVRAVLSENPSLLRSPYDDALKSAAVTLAANRSAEQGGQTVQVAELIGTEL